MLPWLKISIIGGYKVSLEDNKHPAKSYETMQSSTYRSPVQQCSAKSSPPDRDHAHRTGPQLQLLARSSTYAVPLEPATSLASHLSGPVEKPTISGISPDSPSTLLTPSLSHASTDTTSDVLSSQLSHTSLARNNDPHSLSYLSNETHFDHSEILRVLTPRPTTGPPASGWPQVEISYPAPTTRDRKSRFFPKLMSWTGTNSGPASHQTMVNANPSVLDSEYLNTSVVSQNHNPSQDLTSAHYMSWLRQPTLHEDVFQSLPDQGNTNISQPCSPGYTPSPSRHTHTCPVGMDEEDCRIERSKRKKRRRKSKKKQTQAATDVATGSVHQNDNNNDSPGQPDFQHNYQDGAQDPDIEPLEEGSDLLVEEDKEYEPLKQGKKKRRRKRGGRGRGKITGSRAVPQAEIEGEDDVTSETNDRSKLVLYEDELRPRHEEYAGNASYHHDTIAESQDCRMIEHRETPFGVGCRADNEDGGGGEWSNEDPGNDLPVEKNWKSQELLDWEAADSSFWVGC